MGGGHSQNMGGGGGAEGRIMDLFWFLVLVLKVFLWGFQIIPQVPNLFIKTFPIALQIYPIWFCPKFNSHA
jgi:hypothetical protein